MIKGILKLFLVIFFFGCVTESRENFKSFDYLPQNTFLVFKVNEISQIKSSNLLTNILSIEKDYKDRFNLLLPSFNSEEILFFFTRIGKNKDALSFISNINETDTIMLYNEKIMYSGIEIGIKI